MRRTTITFTLMLLAGTAQAQVAGDCAALAPQATSAIPVNPIAPIAPELLAPGHRLGAATGVLAQALDESLSLDQVLLRMRISACRNVATTTPVRIPGSLVAPTPAITAPTLPTSTDPAAYKPRTEFDNTPWRFDMNQNGKRMTADEFSAWLKAKGVRVATGAPAAVSLQPPVASAATVLPPAAPVEPVSTVPPPAAPVAPALPKADPTESASTVLSQAAPAEPASTVPPAGTSTPSVPAATGTPDVPPADDATEVGDGDGE